MRVIGIVGGVGSGKSRVADQFAQLGAEVIRADDIGHDVLDHADVQQALRDRWGSVAFGPEGKVDRRAVARIVFGQGPAAVRELRFLESITHPKIERILRERLAELTKRGDVSVVVLDAAILLEAGWDSVCDRIIFIDTTREQRIERVCGRGWTAADIASREAAQLSLEEKRKVADGVIDNSGSFDHTFAQVKQSQQSC